VRSRIPQCYCACIDSRAGCQHVVNDDDAPGRGSTSSPRKRSFDISPPCLHIKLYLMFGVLLPNKVLNDRHLVRTAKVVCQQGALIKPAFGKTTLVQRHRDQGIARKRMALHICAQERAKQWSCPAEAGVFQCVDGLSQRPLKDKRHRNLINMRK
jgi:hypothetical protein